MIMRLRRSHIGVAVVAVCLLVASISFHNPFTDKIEGPANSSAVAVHALETVSPNRKPRSKIREHVPIADVLPALHACIAEEPSPESRHPLDLYSCLLEARAMAMDAAAAGKFFDEAAYLQDSGCLTLPELLDRIKNNSTPEALEALKGLVVAEMGILDPVQIDEHPLFATDDNALAFRVVGCRSLLRIGRMLDRSSPELLALTLAIEDPDAAELLTPALFSHTPFDYLPPEITALAVYGYDSFQGHEPDPEFKRMDVQRLVLEFSDTADIQDILLVSSRSTNVPHLPTGISRYTKDALEYYVIVLRTLLSMYPLFTTDQIADICADLPTE